MANLHQMIQGLQKMQHGMKQVQEDLAKQSFDGTSGGGAIRCTVSGDLHLQSISIEPSVLENPEKELLEDLIKSAVNDAMGKARDAAASKFQGLTGNLGLPPGLI